MANPAWEILVYGEDVVACNDEDIVKIIISFLI